MEFASTVLYCIKHVSKGQVVTDAPASEEGSPSAVMNTVLDYISLMAFCFCYFCFYLFLPFVEIIDRRMKGR